MNQCVTLERGVKVLIYKAVLIAVQVSFEAWVAGCSPPRPLWPCSVSHT